MLLSKGTCHDRIDTFFVEGGMEQPVIAINVFTLSTALPYSAYQWLYNGALIPGATSATYLVTENGVLSDFSERKTAMITRLG